MRYLKLKRCDGIYDYLPLESCIFGFIQIDDNEYRVEVDHGKYCDTLFDKKYLSSTCEFMKKIASLPDGEIITVSDLL